MATSPNFDAWLDGLGAVEEDHVFMPPNGKISDELAGLYRQRQGLLKEDEDGNIVPGELAAGESYSGALDDIDERIHAQLQLEAPTAPRFRLRGLSDDDYTQANAEVREWRQSHPDASRDEEIVEGNVRVIARAVLIPEGVTVDDIRLLRTKLNRGEWARLLSHVTRLANDDAEATSVPN